MKRQNNRDVSVTVPMTMTSVIVVELHFVRFMFDIKKKEKNIDVSHAGTSLKFSVSIMLEN
jgi:hypothetical protein